MYNYLLLLTLLLCNLSRVAVAENEFFEMGYDLRGPWGEWLFRDDANWFQPCDDGNPIGFPQQGAKVHTGQVVGPNGKVDLALQREFNAGLSKAVEGHGVSHKFLREQFHERMLKDAVQRGKGGCFYGPRRMSVEAILNFTRDFIKRLPPGYQIVLPPGEIYGPGIGVRMGPYSSKYVVVPSPTGGLMAVPDSKTGPIPKGYPVDDIPHWVRELQDHGDLRRQGRPSAVSSCTAKPQVPPPSPPETPGSNSPAKPTKLQNLKNICVGGAKFVAGFGVLFGVGILGSVAGDCVGKELGVDRSLCRFAGGWLSTTVTARLLFTNSLRAAMGLSLLPAQLIVEMEFGDEKSFLGSFGKARRQNQAEITRRCQGVLNDPNAGFMAKWGAQEAIRDAGPGGRHR